MKIFSFLIVFYSLFGYYIQAKPTTGDYVGIYLPVLYKTTLQDKAENNLNSELVKHKTHIIYGIGISQNTFLELGYQHNYVKDIESEYDKYLSQFDASFKYFNSELEKYNTYGFGVNMSLLKTNDIRRQVQDFSSVIGMEVNYSFLIPFSNNEDHYVQLRLIYPILSLDRNEYTDVYKSQNIRISVAYRYHF